MRDIEVGREYRHFKGGVYTVLNIATHTETGEKFVVYLNSEDTTKTYVRPYDMFSSEVDHAKYPNTKQKYRFERIEPSKSYALDWDSLLCAKRERAKSTTSHNDHRSDFESDYDRVVFSSPFRRLQDKAQVFPLERIDFVRTRLTHSMEVAAIARSIGVSVEKQMLKKGRIKDEKSGIIPVILETAGLAHDIGNPPFGHFGEESIRNTFDEWLKDHHEFKIDEAEKEDLLKFDGNCQMFRILTHLQCIKDEYGLNLTYATLATLMKYPFNSLEGNKDKDYRKTHGEFFKKFGYFQSEESVAYNVLRNTGLKKDDHTYRHPLAFLLEAADDIAYSACDLEDGFKKGLFTLEEVLRYFDGSNETEEYNRKKCEEIQKIVYSKEYYSPEKKLQDIRIILQGFMIESVIDAFDYFYDDIMSGKFKDELLNVSNAGRIRGILKQMSVEKIFQNSEIEKVELGGEVAIKNIANRFLEAFGSDSFINYVLNRENNLSPSQSRMYRLISSDYRKVFEEKVEELSKEYTEDKLRDKVFYQVCIMVVDYISGMTDNYCTDLYKQLNGIVI